jgi:hypothetical protein
MEVQAPAAERGRSFLLTGEGRPYLLVPLIPVAVVLEFMHADARSCLTAALDLGKPCSPGGSPRGEHQFSPR